MAGKYPINPHLGKKLDYFLFADHPLWVPVKATFNGVPYTGSLIKYGHPLHSLGIPKAIREQTGKDPGDTIEVVVWKDEEVRTVEVPVQFES